MNSNQSIEQGQAGDVLREAATRALLRRLNRAAEVIRANSGAAEAGVCELLSEALDQARSWEAARSATGGSGAARTEREGEIEGARLAFTALRGNPGEPVREFLLIPFGSVQMDRPAAGGSFEFTRRHAESARRWFEQIGRKLAIDYEHQSYDRFNTRPDGLRPAAGWIGRLEVRDDGLWATDVTWTQRATELLRTAEYRYFSPVIYWTDDEQTDVAALGPVALTNDPAMRGVPALAASRHREDPARLAEEDESDDAQQTDEPALLQERLREAEHEISTLRRRLSHQEADTFVERGMRLGKIVDATALDWRAEYLRSAEAAEERLQRAPALLPQGRFLERDERGHVKPLSRGRESVGHSVLRRWGVEPADLEAFERAAAEGRVQSSRVSG